MKRSVDKVAEAMAAPGAALGEPFELLRLLWSVSHALHSTSKRMEATLGITGPQRLALNLVGRFPEITAGQLANLMHVDPSTLTGILQRLVRRGLVHRRPDAKDWRRALLGLTTKGRRFEVATKGLGPASAVETTVARTIGRLPRGDVAAARRTLTALAASLSTPVPAAARRGRLRATAVRF